MWGKKGRKRHHTQNYPASRRTARSKCWKQLLCGACKDATACTQHHSFFPINTSHFTALLFYSPLQTTASLGFHLLGASTSSPSLISGLWARCFSPAWARGRAGGGDPGGHRAGDAAGQAATGNPTSSQFGEHKAS